jgi:hypothetical protein
VAPSLSGWAAAAAATADRIGLVLCGDVPTAMTVVARGGPSASLADGALLEAARAHEGARALLAFAATEAHFLLRQKTRVAVA